MDALFVEERFCGPPGTGNGGYVCGRLAARISASAVEVTLRQPVPLMRPLAAEVMPDATVMLRDADTIIAEAKPQTAFEIEPPLVPTYQDALRAMPRYLGFTRHAFPRCFVCGPSRQEGDGLRIFAGSLDGLEHTVVAPWTPDGSLADMDGRIQPEFIWAALDCPGAFAVMDKRPRSMLLGRMTARISSSVRAEQPHVVLAWRIAVEGKKHIAGSALFHQQGEVKGVAKAIWFDVSTSAP